MDGEPTSFWGKLKKDDSGNVLSWHPLEDHCADVAACCWALLEHSLLSVRLARLAGVDVLPSPQRARLCVLAALHDLGKYNVGFQNKALSEPPFTAGHVAELTCLFGCRGYREEEVFLEAIQAERLASWGDAEGVAVVGLLLASVAHHGRPVPTSALPSLVPRLWRPTQRLDPFSGMRALTKQALSWFPDAEQTCAPFPINAAFQHAFSGLVMLADWMGSNLDFFPYKDAEDRQPRIDFAREQASRVLAEMGLAPQQTRATLGLVRPSFAAVSPHAPRALQNTILGLPVSPGGELTILEAETGSGKTEAALARFLHLFHAGQVDGLYFALPTRTAATQIHERVRQAVARAFPEPSSRPPVVLAVPGYLQVDDVTGVRLPGFEVLWNDQDQERFRARYWAAENSKRYLAGAIVVGTIDQVLLSTLQVPHAHLRASALLRQLLVIDEVHASDAYMTRLLQSVLEYHRQAGGYALLMSATLGSAARCQLSGQPVPPLEQACLATYPVLTRFPGNEPPHEEPIRDPSPARSVAIELARLMEAPEVIAERALHAAASGGRVLVLRNTVRGCLEVQQAIEALAQRQGQLHLLFSCAGLPAPHHARFSREDRQTLDQALESVFAPRDHALGCVAVATQTVQQSLDLDADLLLTDLCPMDVLLQRLGRLHRHRDRDPHRKESFRQARAVVLTPPERDLGVRIARDGKARGAHGLGTVYDDLRILEATWRLLERHPTLLIPTLCRELVERTTHPDALRAIVQELGDPWDAHQRVTIGALLAQRQTAGVLLVDRKQAFGEACFLDQDSELARKIKTRLGEEDRLLTFATPLASPFGHRVHRLTLPAHLAKGLSETDQPTLLPGQDGFSVGPLSFRYDRLGLRPIEDEPSPEFHDA